MPSIGEREEAMTGRAPETPRRRAMAIPPSQPRSGEERQLWNCVDMEGFLTGCPPYRDDAHIVGQRVSCPTCGNYTAQRAEDPAFPKRPNPEPSASERPGKRVF